MPFLDVFTNNKAFIATNEASKGYRKLRPNKGNVGLIFIPEVIYQNMFLNQTFNLHRWSTLHVMLRACEQNTDFLLPY